MDTSINQQKFFTCPELSMSLKVRNMISNKARTKQGKAEKAARDAAKAMATEGTATSVSDANRLSVLVPVSSSQAADATASVAMPTPSETPDVVQSIEVADEPVDGTVKITAAAKRKRASESTASDTSSTPTLKPVLQQASGKKTKDASKHSKKPIAESSLSTSPAPELDDPDTSITGAMAPPAGPMVMPGQMPVSSPPPVTAFHANDGDTSMYGTDYDGDHVRNNGVDSSDHLASAFQTQSPSQGSLSGAPATNFGDPFSDAQLTSMSEEVKAELDRLWEEAFGPNSNLSDDDTSPQWN